LTEIFITIAVIVVISGIIVININSIANKNSAKECSGNLVMLKN